jgi:F0F1-type ATP synthase delta subunit
VKSKQSAAALPNSVFSPQDLAAVILEIKLYARWAAHAAVKQQLKQSFTSQSPSLTSAASELLRPYQKQTGQQTGHQLAKSCEQLIHDLSELKARAPIVTITLAAPPAKDTKTLLVSWCRQNIGPGVLVTFQFNSTLLGGMVVRFGSHIYDWSFRRQILENRGKFAEVLRRV